MPEKEEVLKIKVKRLEEGIDGYLNVVFESSYGESSVSVDKKYIQIFLPGAEYIGVFKIKGMPDFVGEKDEWKNVCTMNYSLERIIGEYSFRGNVINDKLNGLDMKLIEPF